MASPASTQPPVRFILPTKWAWRMRPSDVLRYRKYGTYGQLPKEMYRYLAKTESSALGGQIHEAVMIFPLLSLAVGTLGIVVLFSVVPSGSTAVMSVLLLAEAALVSWVVWSWLEWNRNLIFITPYRIIKMHGIVTRRVAMMPISKVTDMDYIKTPFGMLLGYGTFVVESAGQDQALRKINFVPDADATYQYLQDRLFRSIPTEVHVVGVNLKEPGHDDIPERERPKTGKRIPIAWTGRYKGNGNGGQVEQDDDLPW
jgi:membrane protein YdbS with pleckstrin-like domain